MCKRIGIPRNIRNYIFERDNNICVYCGSSATVLDHIKPYRDNQDNRINNLVASCWDCNAIAGGKIFHNLIEKKKYILTSYKNNPRWRGLKPYPLTLTSFTLCPCGIFFTPFINGATNILCPQCAYMANLYPEEREYRCRNYCSNYD